MSINFVTTNNAATTLAAAIGPTATTFSVASGTGALFASPVGSQVLALTIISASNPSVLEIVYCTSRSGDAFTVERAQESTAAGSWGVGDLVQARITAGVLASFSAAATAVQSVGAGSGISVDNSVPTAPVISVAGVAMLAGAAFTGNVSVGGTTTLANTTVNTLTINGTVVSTGTASFNTSSLRYKSNVKPLKYDPDKFLKVMPIHYTDNRNQRDGMGFSAENFAELYPELVLFEKGQPEAVNYIGFISQCALMIQAQEERIRSLESQLARLLTPQ